MSETPKPLAHAWEATQATDVPKGKPEPANPYKPRKGPHRVAPAESGHFDAAKVAPKVSPTAVGPETEKVSPARQHHLEMLAQAGPALSDPDAGPIEVEGGIVLNI